MPAQEEAEKSRLRYRDEQVGIPAALAQTANHQETAPMDFLWSLATNRIEQSLKVRNSRNFSTLLNKGIWHQLHLADPMSKRVARGTSLAELIEHNRLMEYHSTVRCSHLSRGDERY